MNNGFEVGTSSNRLENQRALIIDDDPDTVNLLKIIIHNAGMEVDSAYSGWEALQKCADIQPHIILLDLMMPGMDGWETYRGLRKMTDAPVIIISAISRKEQVVKGLQMGFDDYLVKPFVAQELIARIQAVLRRAAISKPITTRVFPTIGLVINFQTCEVTLSGQTIALTPKEFSTLAILARMAPRIVKYEEISKEIWGEDFPQGRRRVKYLIHALRRKLEDDPSRPKLILNREGLGYKLNI